MQHTGGASRSPRLGVLAVFVSAAVVASSGAAPVAAQSPSEASSARHLSGERWHHRAQVDGRGGLDRITITALPGFVVTNGMGMGTIRVRVDFAGGHRFAEAVQPVSYYSVRSPWTPWLGATNLDRRGGKEIVLGFSTGAHAQGFIAYTYRPNGELLPLRAPRRSESWFLNSSYGTGTSGWKCTRRGVQSRAVSPSGGRTVKLTRIWYRIGRSGDWRRTKRVVRTVMVDAQGNPPARTGTYANFVCPGLPGRVL